jgi:hypothetical protein
MKRSLKPVIWMQAQRIAGPQFGVVNGFRAGTNLPPMNTDEELKKDQGHC